MAQSIRIPDRELELVRREAKLSGRTIAEQVAHWMRIGHSIERSADFNYARVCDALRGRCSPDILSAEEHAVYINDLMAEASEVTSEQQTFFAKRRKMGVGVGLDVKGDITRQRSKTPR